MRPWVSPLMPWVVSLLVGALAFYCPASSAQSQAEHYLLYDVHSGEGFNLRRDALLRAALTTRLLGPEWTLVLPPFGALPHWNNREATVDGLPWRTFFDVQELARVVPVIEFEQYVARQSALVDHVLHLGAVPFPDPVPVEPIIETRSCETVENFNWHPVAVDDMDAPAVLGPWRGLVFSSRLQLQARKLVCMGIFGPYPAIVPLLQAEPGSVLVERFERLFWDGRFAGEDYWTIRQHLVFAEALRSEAQRFQRETFGETPYLAVHLRRGDFVRVHEVPTLADVAGQLKDILDRTGLQQVFVASDASEAELDELRQSVSFAVYRPGPDNGKAWLDGEVAIIDQVLAANGAYFVGTESSTFSTVIMEERELAGMPPETTWNVLCGSLGGKADSQSGEEGAGCSIPRRQVMVGK